MRYYVVVLFVLLHSYVVQLVHGTLTNPAMLNYITIQTEHNIEQSIVRMDDASKTIFSLLIGRSVVETTSLVITQIDPQTGLLDEESVVHMMIPITENFYGMESPMPNKVAIVIGSFGLCDSNDGNGTFLLINSDGDIEQSIDIDIHRILVKSNQQPDSPLFNSLFLFSLCGEDLIVLKWNGSQYDMEYQKFLDFFAFAVVGDIVYGVLEANTTFICQYDLQQLFAGNATGVSCSESPLLPDGSPVGDTQSVVVSPSYNRMAWITVADISGYILIYDIPSFEYKGYVLLSTCYTCLQNSMQFSEFGDLLFGEFGDYNIEGKLQYRFQDVSSLPITQTIQSVLFPPFLGAGGSVMFGPDLIYATMTRGAQFTYTNYFVQPGRKFYLIGFDTSPMFSPSPTATLGVYYLNILENTDRGIIWAIQDSIYGYGVNAITIEPSFTAHTTVAKFQTNCTVGLTSWYSTNSTYIVLVGANITCVIDTSLVFENEIQLVTTFPTYENELVQQIMWIDDMLVNIRILNGEYWDIKCFVCIGENNTNCPRMHLTPRILNQFEVAIATRPTEIFIVSIDAYYSEFSSSSVYIFPVYSNISLGDPETILLTPNCTFLASKLYKNEEIWFACWQKNALYTIYQLDIETLSLGCIVPTNVNYPNSIEFSIREDGQLLSVFTPAELRVYDISRCHQNDSQAFPVLLSIYVPQDSYTTLVLFEANGANLQLGLGVTGLDIITDCGVGMQPNKGNFCSKCTPGTSGILCQNCSGGYICEGYGTTIPNTPCPPGYFCSPGTSSFDLDEPGGPTACPAGTYCPFGIAYDEVDLTVINSPRWCPQGYYCPVGSSKPDENSCNAYSNTKGVGARSMEDCVCNYGFWGHSGNCFACPDECECRENIIVGCYVEITNYTNLMVACPPYNLNGSTPCNPDRLGWNGTGDFPCADGYSGRLCSKCLPSHYRQARQCVVCQDNFKWKLPLAYSVICIVATVYVWLSKASSSAVILILAFHFQTLYALITGGNQWNIFPTNFFYWASSASSFSLKAIECLFPWWHVDVKLIYYLLLPVVYLLLAVCSAVVSFIVSLIHNKCFSSDPPPAAYYRTKSAKLIVYLFNFNYFSVVMAIFSVLATDDGYLNTYPWMKFSTSLAVIAGVGLVFEGFVVPLLMAITIWRHMREADGWVKGVFGSLYCVYVPSKYYWMLVVTARRVAIACIVAFSPYNSPLLLIGIIAIVLIYMFVQINVKPYIRTMDNIFESTSHFILVCTLAISLMVEIPRMHKHVQTLVYTAVAMNTLFLCVSILYAIYSFKDGVLDNIKSSFGIITGSFGTSNSTHIVNAEERPLLAVCEVSDDDKEDRAVDKENLAEDSS